MGEAIDIILQNYKNMHYFSHISEVLITNLFAGFFYLVFYATMLPALSVQDTKLYRIMSRKGPVGYPL